MGACPACGGEGVKVLYMAIPMRLCVPHKEVFGGWSWVMEWLPFNGYFVRYDDYWPTVWDWMRGRIQA